MSEQTATAGKILIAFVAGAVLTAIAAASMWPRESADSEGPRTAVPHRETMKAEAVPKDEQVSDTAFCKVVSDYARMVMESRQKGVAMADMIEISEKASPEVGPALKKMIVAAFEEPRMAVEVNQQRRIRDFENDAYLDCIKS